MAARNGPTSPSSWQVSRPSWAEIPLTPGTRVRSGSRPWTRSSTWRLRRARSAVDVLERDEPAGPDDRDPVADPLDLGQDVRAEEDRPAGRAKLVEDVVEGALHERVEALGRLVEDGQLGVVLEGLDDADLLAHPARVVADRPAERLLGQLEPVEQLGPPDRRPAVELAEVVEQVEPGHPVVQGDPAGQVADPAADLDRGSLGCRARGPRPGRRSGGGSRGAAGSSCSCRPRSARGTRRSRRRSPGSTGRSARRPRSPAASGPRRGRP